MHTLDAVYMPTCITDGMSYQTTKRASLLQETNLQVTAVMVVVVVVFESVERDTKEWINRKRREGVDPIFMAIQFLLSFSLVGPASQVHC